MLTRRSFIKSAIALPIGGAIATYQTLSAPARGLVKITAVKAMSVRGGGAAAGGRGGTVAPGGRGGAAAAAGGGGGGGTMIKIETDAGIDGYGPVLGSGPLARAVIAEFMSDQGSAKGLGLIGKDPLAIEVHHHNMFYAWAQRYRQMRILSGIDIALWDVAGKILDMPVSKLLGGNFREEIELYSHCGHEGNFWDKAEWTARAKELVEQPAGFRAFKVDLNDALGVIARQYVPAIGPRDVAKVTRCYDLAREAFGPDIDIDVHGHNELDISSAIQVARAVEHIKPMFFEDAMDPNYSESWIALRHSTNTPLLVGEDVELVEGAAPFIQNLAVDYLQPDLVNSGGITGVKKIADYAIPYRFPICLHNVGGLLLNLASQQFAAAVHNCDRIECSRGSDKSDLATGNVPIIKNGRMKVANLPGIGFLPNNDYLKAHLAEGEPWWG
ncbi:MAG: mandelate racemase/muconate lactonizing enzyme family protein [Bryobacteraceae bacterium]|jgi:L-alanine-DL-glutamate epimerase-like enolase superfamily enzyme